MSSSLPPERSWSLALRLTVWYVGSAFLLVFGATGALYWALVRHLDREDDEFLVDRVRLLRALLADGDGDDSPALRRALEGEGGRPFGPIRIRVLDERGVVQRETPDFPAALPIEAFPPPVPLDGGRLPAAEVETADGRAFRVGAVRTTVGPAERTFQLAFDRTAEEALLESYRLSLWTVLSVALVVCAVVGYQGVRRGLRPLHDITAAAQRVQSTTLHERLPARRLPSELAALADTFNAMLDRLEDSFRRLDQFAADIAHELRTPVNNLRLAAEVALGQPRSPEEYREALASSLEESVRLTRLIDSLLFLARAGADKVPLDCEVVDVAAELERVRDFFEPAAAEAGVRLVVAADAITARLDRALFHRAVSNLVANALAHTAPGGTVTLRAAAEPNGVRLDVEDTGEGIAPQHLPHVFDRFYRADAARTTASGRVGLGLAIVKSIAELHGGTAAIVSEPGRGTRVTLTFHTSSF